MSTSVPLDLELAEKALQTAPSEKALAIGPNNADPTSMEEEEKVQEEKGGASKAASEHDATRSALDIEVESPKRLTERTESPGTRMRRLESTRTRRSSFRKGHEASSANLAAFSLRSPSNGSSSRGKNSSFSAGEDDELVLDPRGRVRLIVEAVMIVVIVWQTFLIPLAWAFPGLSEDSLLWCAFDIFSDAAFVLDVGVGCITAYFNEEMLLVTNRVSITAHYASGPLFADLVAAIPLLTLCRFTSLPQSVTVLKLGKFCDFLHHNGRGGVVPGKSALFKKLRDSPFVKKFAQLCILIAVFFGFMHYEACIFFYLGNRSYERGEANWISEAAIQDDTPSEQYWTSIYFAVTTVTTVGYGDISPVSKDERVFASVMMLCATILHAVVFGSVTTTVLDMNKKRNAATDKLEKVNLFMAHCRLPHILQVKIREFYEYKFERAGKHGMTQMEDLTSELPQLLSSRIVDHIHFAIRQNNPVLSIFPSHLWRMIVREAKEHIFAPHDYVYIKGEAVKDFFVIKQGRVGLEDKDGDVLTVFSHDAFFGELELFSKIARDNGYGSEKEGEILSPKGGNTFDSLLYLQGNTRREYSVATLGYCELYSVALEDLDLAFSEPEFDEARHLLCEVAYHRHLACKRRVLFRDAKVISTALMHYSDHAVKRKNISAQSLKKRQEYISSTPPQKSERRFGGFTRPRSKSSECLSGAGVPRRKSSEGATVKMFSKNRKAGARNAVAPAIANNVDAQNMVRCLQAFKPTDAIGDVLASIQADGTVGVDDRDEDEAINPVAQPLLAARAAHSLAAMQDSPEALWKLQRGLNDDELMQLWKNQELRRRRSIALAETKLGVMKKKREDNARAVTSVASKFMRLSTRNSAGGTSQLPPQHPRNALQ
jgi:CRP-like cAMP-binding protein